SIEVGAPDFATFGTNLVQIFLVDEHQSSERFVQATQLFTQFAKTTIIYAFSSCKQTLLYVLLDPSLAVLRGRLLLLLPSYMIFFLPWIECLYIALGWRKTLDLDDPLLHCDYVEYGAHSQSRRRREQALAHLPKTSKNSPLFLVRRPDPRDI
ncbi:unnamed protein product, partial [Amoebophrya sp. A25]